MTYRFKDFNSTPLEISARGRRPPAWGDSKAARPGMLARDIGGGAALTGVADCDTGADEEPGTAGSRPDCLRAAIRAIGSDDIGVVDFPSSAGRGGGGDRMAAATGGGYGDAA